MLEYEGMNYHVDSRLQRVSPPTRLLRFLDMSWEESRRFPFHGPSAQSLAWLLSD